MINNQTTIFIVKHYDDDYGLIVRLITHIYKYCISILVDLLISSVESQQVIVLR